MDYSRPTWADVRTVFFPTGTLGAIGLAAWADASPEHLWTQSWFRAALALFVVVALVGVYGFIAHWKLRSIGAILIVFTAVAVFLHWSPFAIWALFVLTFVATVYRFSQESRGAKDTELSTPEAAATDTGVRVVPNDAQAKSTAPPLMPKAVTADSGVRALPNDTQAKSRNDVKATVPAKAAPESTSYDQITQERDRIYVTRSIVELTAIYRERLAPQADKLFEVFKGKWLRIQGPINSVSKDGQHYSQVTMKSDEWKPVLLVFLRFYRETDLDRLTIAAKGEELTAVGQIDRAEQYYLYLNRCEIIP
jgi:hypothetical protein